MTLSLALNLLLLGLIATVTVMLTWLHVRFRRLMRANYDMPFLSAKLAKSLMEVRQGIEDLRTTAQTKGSDLERNLAKATEAMQDLDFVLNRAEKVLVQLDERLHLARGHGASGVRQAQPAVAEKVTSTVEARVERAPERVVERSAPAAAPAERMERKVTPFEPRRLTVEEAARQQAAAEQPRRMASPGGMASSYGSAATMQKPAAIVSESEQELRRALKEKL